MSIFQKDDLLIDKYTQASHVADITCECERKESYFRPHFRRVPCHFLATRPWTSYLPLPLSSETDNKAPPQSRCESQKGTDALTALCVCLQSRLERRGGKGMPGRGGGCKVVEMGKEGHIQTALHRAASRTQGSGSEDIRNKAEERSGPG